MSVRVLPGDKTLLCDPFTNPALRESHVRLNPDIRDETSLNIFIDGLDVDFQKLFEFLRRPDTIFHRACDLCMDGFGVLPHLPQSLAPPKPWPSPASKREFGGRSTGLELPSRNDSSIWAGRKGRHREKVVK